jgi:hypothetical protein
MSGFRAGVGSPVDRERLEAALALCSICELSLGFAFLRMAGCARRKAGSGPFGFMR